MNALFAFLRMPHLRVQVLLSRHIRSFMKVHFLYAGIECGLFKALETPAYRGDLMDRLGVRRPELFEVLLDLGVRLRELSRDRVGLYRLRSSTALALASDDGDSIAAFIQEHVYYHGSVYRNFAERLRGGPLGDYLPETGTMIAQSSRLLEPFVAGFVKKVVKSGGPVTLLEIGCGSGIYLRHAARANPNLTGVGIDLRREVVDQAVQNLSDWGLGERFKVVTGDIRNPPEGLDGQFDLITLYNNIYYFDLAEYSALFKGLRSRLSSRGALAIVSVMQGRSLTSLDLDLALRSTVGCARLPGRAELIKRLKESGFADVRSERLMPGQPLFGLIAR